MMNLVSRRGRTTVALAAVLTLAMAGVADARAGRSGSFGSRGGRTFSPPAQTQTAPNQARPLDRTITQPGPQTAQPGVRAPGAPGQVGAPAGRFGGGFLGGFLGAGLIGALLGAGLFGGLGSLAGILGFLLQAALLVGLVMLVMRLFRRRSEPQTPRPAYQGAGGISQRSALGGMTPRMGSGGPIPARAPAMAGAAGAGAATAQPAQAPVNVTPADFDAFERTLYDVQSAYNAGNEGRLRQLATPEVAAYLGEDLARDEAKGLKAVVTNVKLLQGDLAEAWREDGADYATVAMRFALNEGVVERATGRVVEGDPNRASEATEIWTFRRERGEDWRVSAIQQTA